MPTKKLETNPKHDFENLLIKWNKRPAELKTTSAKINAVNFVGLRRHLEDAKIFVERMKETNYILRRNFNVLLSKGITNPYREAASVVQLKPNLIAKRMKAKTLMRKNKILLQKIQKVKGEIEVTSHRPLHPKCQRQLGYKRFVPPTQILEKYKTVKLPQGEPLWQVLRPRIWLELETMRVPYSQQGRITIELYTEAAPMVVREFIKCCYCQHKNRIRMLRLFPNLWLEGEIKLDDERLIKHPLEYDMRALQHDAGSGILSFPMEFVNGFHYGVLSFTISSRPLHVLNGKRVAFGRVIRGMKTIDILQEYGTKNGKLKKPLVVIACGLET